jgi:hypothetical protein
LLQVLDIREGRARSMPVTLPSYTFAWARGGHRLASKTGFTATGAVAVRVWDAERDDPPLEIPDIDPGLEQLAWIDASRLLLRDRLRNPIIVDVSSDAPVTTSLDAPDSHGQQLLGDRCVVYVGGCGPSKLLGTCVAALDPAGPPQPRRIFPGDDDLLAMPTHGSPLVFDDWRDNRIIEVALDGDAFEPRRLTDRTYRDEQHRTAVLVASGPDPSWVYYSAPWSSLAPLTTPHFWNRRSRRTYAFDPQSRVFDLDGVWSPDGTVLAMSATGGLGAGDQPSLMLTRLDGSVPLQQYSVHLAIAKQTGDGDGWLVWQP